MKKKFGKTAIILITLSVIIKLIGLLRDTVLADCYGAGTVSDAYLIAITVPTLLFYFIGQALSTSFIPMYTKVEHEKGLDEARRYSNKIMTVSLIISTVIALIIILFPRIIVFIFASGFDDERIKITVDILRISAVTIYLMTMINILSSRLQLNGSFIIPSIISLPRNIVLIVSVILSTYFGLWWLGFGIVLAYLSELLFLIPSLIRNGIKIGLNFSFKDPYLKETLKIVLPVFLTVAVSQINKIIDRTMASNFAVGSVSALYYASIINTAIQEIMVISIVAMIFTNVSKLVANNEYEQVDVTFHKTIRMLRFVLLPAMVGMLILAEPIVEMMFGRGNFNDNAVIITTDALRGYTLGLCFLASREVLIKVLYSYKKTKITFIASTIGIGFNILLNSILGKVWGAAGLAAATSISAVCQYIILLIYYKKMIWNFKLTKYLLTMVKPLIGCIIMGCIVFVLDTYLTYNLNNFLRIFIDVIVGIIFYVIIELCLKAKEFNIVLQAFRKIDK